MTTEPDYEAAARVAYNGWLDPHDWWELVSDHTREIRIAEAKRIVDAAIGSPADILAVVRTLDGVEEVRRCVRHRADVWEPAHYCRSAWPDHIDDCVLVSVLVVPIPREET